MIYGTREYYYPIKNRVFQKTESFENTYNPLQSREIKTGYKSIGTISSLFFFLRKTCAYIKCIGKEQDWK